MPARGWVIALACCAAGCGDTVQPTDEGGLEISVSTTGGDFDLDGYSLLVDQTVRRRVAVQDQVTLSGLAPGVHLVGLGDAAPNCDVESGLTSVRVQAGATTPVELRAHCYVTGIVLTTTTVGLDPDPDGYVLTLAGQEVRLPTNGEVTVGMLPPGTYELQLDDLAPNCVLDPVPDPFEVTINFRSTISRPLRFACLATTGVLGVGVTVAGEDPDDFFSVTLSGGQFQPVQVGTTTFIDGVSPGEQVVRLSGVSANCAVDPSEHVVQVTAGGEVRDTVRVEFALSCVRGGEFAFVRYEANEGVLEPWITLARLDQETTIQLAMGEHPTWAADGQRVAYRVMECYLDFYYPYPYCFGNGLGIYDLRNGSRVVVTQGSGDAEPDWRPNGAEIVFVRNQTLYLVALSSGTVEQVLAGFGDFPASQPTWSPDGDTLAFVCELEPGNKDICTVRANGGFLKRLTSGPEDELHPSWSPEGDAIAFTRSTGGATSVLMVMNADGSGATALASGEEPAWRESPGLLFRHLDCTSGGGCSFGLARINRDGTGLTSLISRPSDESPAWRP